METTTIYVELFDEGVEVWRPVEAVDASGGLFRIVTESHDTEKWAFATGQVVRCEQRRLSGGLVLVAVQAVS